MKPASALSKDPVVCSSSLNGPKPDLTDLARKIDLEHSAARIAFSKGLEHVLCAGELLIQAKKAIGHGQWLPWLEANTSVSVRTAQVYMRLAKAVPKLPREKAQRVAHLSLRDAIAAISADTQRTARLPESSIETVLVKASAGNKLRLATTDALEKIRRRSMRQASDEIPHGNQVTESLITYRQPADYELALARALLKTIAEVAQKYPQVNHHTVDAVIEMITSGLDEVWPLDPDREYL